MSHQFSVQIAKTKQKKTKATTVELLKAIVSVFSISLKTLPISRPKETINQFIAKCNE